MGNGACSCTCGGSYLVVGGPDNSGTGHAVHSGIELPRGRSRKAHVCPPAALNNAPSIHQRCALGGDRNHAAARECEATRCAVSPPCCTITYRLCSHMSVTGLWCARTDTRGDSSGVARLNTWPCASSTRLRRRWEHGSARHRAYRFKAAPQPAIQRIESHGGGGSKQVLENPLMPRRGILTTL